jgi:crossover junction endonuclease MUS81
MLDKDTVFMGDSVLAMPPCQTNESFLEAYEVVLTLDNRENFGFVRSSYSHCKLYLLF